MSPRHQSKRIFGPYYMEKVNHPESKKDLEAIIEEKVGFCWHSLLKKIKFWKK